jgi:cell division protease FtsH
MTVGFSGADLKNLANEAALLAARKEKSEVGMDEFIMGRDKIIMGIEREDVISDEEKKAVACHEAGHALIALFLAGADPLEKVTIIPRGRSLGATEQIPKEDRHNLGRQYLLNRIAVMLGGRAAEKVMFNDITTGAGDDLKRASQLARQMVCQWGMSEKLGPATFRHGEKHPFIGKEMAEPKDFSEYTAQIIDQEVQQMLKEMENKAMEILQHHRDKLVLLVESLLENETLNRHDVDQLIGPIEET